MRDRESSKKENIIRRELTSVLTPGTLIDGGFLTNDLSVGWNGFARGRAVEVGVYLWQLNFSRIREDGTERTFESNGTVTVLRE